MTPEELTLKARNLSNAEAKEQLRQLLADPRFLAVIKVVVNHMDDYVANASKQAFATHTGCIQHAMGSVHALNTLIDTYAAEAPKARRRALPAGDET